MTDATPTHTAEITFQADVAGQTLTIFADSFYEDHTVGIDFGPELIWGVDAQGNEVDLTDLPDDQLQALHRTAIDCWHQAHPEPDDMGIWDDDPTAQ